MWYVKIIELTLDTHFYTFGIYPRDFKGLIGVFLSPFIHSGWNHLIDNSVPLAVLTLSLLFFYKDIAYRLLF
jgi:membrane associated rhomboid family serine protease